MKRRLSPPLTQTGWPRVLCGRQTATGLKSELWPSSVSQFLSLSPAACLSWWRPRRWCCCPAGAWTTAGLWWRSISGGFGSDFLLLRHYSRMWWSTGEAWLPPRELSEIGIESQALSGGALMKRLFTLGLFCSVFKEYWLLTCSWGALSALAALFTASVERETLQHLHTHGWRVCRGGKESSVEQDFPGFSK